MKIIFLGTNGWYTNENGNTPCILIDSHNHYVILDAGNGFYKLDDYIIEDKPVSLFISHFHLDHVSGLHTLAKFAFPQGLDIFVGQGRTKDFEVLVNPPYTIGFAPKSENIRNLQMEVRLHETTETTSPFPITAIEQHHAYRNHGFRITLDEKTIAYSGDCGITEQSSKLAKDADVLIHECSLKKTSEKNIWGHAGPIDAAKLAKESNVKKLILTHFDPTVYKTMEDRKEAEEEAKTIFPNTTAAYDDLIIAD